MQSCCIDIYDGDSPSFANISYPKARKEHHCCECARTIKPGEKYENVTGCWGGDFSVYKTCQDCKSIRDALFCTWVYGEMFEDIDYYEFRITDLDGMTQRARDKVISIIDERQAREKIIRIIEERF